MALCMEMKMKGRIRSWLVEAVSAVALFAIVFAFYIATP